MIDHKQLSQIKPNRIISRRGALSFDWLKLGRKQTKKTNKQTSFSMIRSLHMDPENAANIKECKALGWEIGADNIIWASKSDG